MFGFRRDRIIKSYVHYRLFVTLLDGASFSGLLLDADSQVFVFADVELATTTTAHTVDGRLIIERDRIAYMQRTAGH